MMMSGVVPPMIGNEIDALQIVMPMGQHEYQIIYRISGHL